MKKVILIFGVLSLLVFIRPVLGMNSSSNKAVTTTTVNQAEVAADSESFVSEALNGIKQF